MSLVTIADCDIDVEHDNPGVNVTLTPRAGEVAGVEYLDVKVTAEKPTRPNTITLFWEHKTINCHQRTSAEWQYKVCGMGRPKTQASAAKNAPVWSMFDYAGNNRLTLAVADAINTCELGGQHAEETACLTFRIKLLMDPVPPLTEYTTTIRFDTREQKYWDATSAVSDWWAAMPEYKPADVPEHAKLPVYSTWYSYHLDITPEGIEKECVLAKKMGMEAVIVDDGWQTAVKHRGYGYCGDWEVAPEKFPDFAGHVKKVHDIGMKYLLWYSVPFVGIYTKAYERFKEKFLSPPKKDDGREWYTLDPRFPDVREYLIDIYERAIRDFDLDGFKLDFVDCFGTHEDTKDSFGDGRDYQSVPEAADRLLTDVIARLKAIKPDVMIEFRQSYIGPAMRKYGNIFRVGDEPNNAAGNRVGSMLLRNLTGNTSVHSDMVMWHYEDTVESAAMQLLHAVFTVPQISVRLADIPKSHVDMIQRYLDFWLEHRDVLLDGKIMPHHPQHSFPVVVAENDKKLAAAAYADGFIPLPEVGNKKVLLINGSYEKRIVIDLSDNLGDVQLKIWSCTGEEVLSETRNLTAGVHSIPVPPAGTCVIG